MVLLYSPLTRGKNKTRTYGPSIKEILGLHGNAVTYKKRHIFFD